MFILVNPLPDSRWRFINIFILGVLKKGYGEFSFNNEVSATQSNKCTKQWYLTALTHIAMIC